MLLPEYGSSWTGQARTRDRGMALIVSVRSCLKEMLSVEEVRCEVWENGERFILRTFRTPVGEVREKHRVEEGYSSEWIVGHMIRRRGHYRVVAFMVRETRLIPNHNAIQELEDNLDGDGVALAWTTCSPYQQMFIELMGIERLALDRHDRLPEFEALRQALEQQHE